MKIYLDIDGVLLTKKQTLPKDASSFIQFTIENYDCYWLTTHCRNGSNQAITYLSQFYSGKNLELLKKVKPTSWDTLKTEAIDFDSEFFWLDDYPFEAEKKVLRSKGKENALLQINLNRPNELTAVIEKLKSFFS